MFELKAYSSGENIAQDHGIAIQSSDYNDNTPASNAIDGSITSFSHTSTVDTLAFWEVDLGSKYLVESVVIMNRWCRDENDSAGCLCRLTGANLTLINEDEVVVFSRVLGNTCDVAELSFSWF